MIVFSGHIIAAEYLSIIIGVTLLLIITVAIDVIGYIHVYVYLMYLINRYDITEMTGSLIISLR